MAERAETAPLQDGSGADGMDGQADDGGGGGGILLRLSLALLPRLPDRGAATHLSVQHRHPLRLQPADPGVFHA